MKPTFATNVILIQSVNGGVSLQQHTIDCFVDMHSGSVHTQKLDQMLERSIRTLKDTLI